MATTKKTTKKMGKLVEFFSALSGFWPVWLSLVFIAVMVLSYDFYKKIDTQEEKEIVVIKEQVLIVPGKIKVEGVLKNINKNKIKKLVFEKLDQGYLASDLASIRQDIEAQAWVRRAIIKRLPPDLLLVNVVEQQPMLRWKNKGLISQQGVLFFPDNMESFTHLAVVYSKNESVEVALELLTESVPILREMELKLKSINEDELNAWEINTLEGVTLKFGRNKFSHRLQILKKLWPSLKRKGVVSKVDLRYSNGAAVSYSATPG